MRRGEQDLRLDALMADPKNARQHDERNLETIAAALREVGAARSVVVDEQNLVLAGNATVAAAARAGITKVRVVDVDGDTLVAVRRRGLSARGKTRLALFDNRAGELAQWNVGILRELMDSGVTLDDLFSNDELAALLAQPGATGRTDPDAIPATRPTSIVRGQCFALGRHRLACGDSTDPGDVARVLGGGPPSAHGH